MHDRPIAEYALLSDCQGAALVHRDGSIDWLALPRFDSPALCARLLGGEGGYWKLGPVDDIQGQRGYVEGSMVVNTTFRSREGEVVIRDALAIGLHQGAHAIGKDSPHAVLREAVCTRGSMELTTNYAPRPEYGLIVPILRPVVGGVLARGGASVLRLSASIPLKTDTSTAHAHFRLEEGQRAAFALEFRSSAEPSPGPWSVEAIQEYLEDTITNWQDWSVMHQAYQGPWREQVHFGGRLLQALTYYPTGAFVAAATTSLPERMGGGLNWDYRYSWVRDASMTLDALWVAACPDEAYKFFDFIADASLAQVRQDRDAQIMFGIGGEHDLTERQLVHLPGWRGSAPVRVGNGAWTQRQFDVYGELLAAAERLRHQLAEHIDPLTRSFLAEVADVAANRWKEPDQGMWEIRGKPRHFLHSKLMCWAALDSAIRLTDLIGGEESVGRWVAARDEIREAILTRGWSERIGAFTQTFHGDTLDASTLVMALSGFLPATDTRMLATIDAIEEHLTDERGLVYRYREIDGEPADEGAFLLCTFWLAHARALAGQVEQAKVVFERAAACANDVGLLSEEFDSRSGEMMGNFPQAFSHIGLINAAWAISQAE
ncbi:glycoside hydrolase family 15 protein [Thiohalomonas denitrificans]|uniref:Glucoamylase (Glucan-1,4-alpha-glucosidase), GH15 family n=1 Tax=Thiohalomonas denitrificans TaxID=415747 RepID=A0A1G5QMS0_9GAMM|nr:glycoside hydrolase family 15 protein [Thiohalomonas denitrificans]SCZ63037.1 Glucoamylase (glucan-1,4-alpha-glucosidase), GH15 family [Thiohalomonas denitrificans]